MIHQHEEGRLPIFDKVIEVLLIVALWLHLRRTPQPA
jgi:hypothetical protein